MNRNETVELFLECEAKRAEARAAALAVGRDELAVELIVHKAAKAHWNAWGRAPARRTHGDGSRRALVG